MVNVFDVAEHVLARYGSASAIKLQKLVYYSQAWHLVARGDRLFSEPIIAYQYGPLTTTLWEHHRGMKTVRAGHFGALVEGHLEVGSVEVIDAVLDMYGPMSMTALVDRTHRERPWIDAQKSGAEITPEDMRIFYSAELAAGNPAPRLGATATAGIANDEEHEEVVDDYSGFLNALRRDR